MNADLLYTEVEVFVKHPQYTSKNCPKNLLFRGVFSIFPPRGFVATSRKPPSPFVRQSHQKPPAGVFSSFINFYFSLLYCSIHRLSIEESMRNSTGNVDSKKGRTNARSSSPKSARKTTQPKVTAASRASLAPSLPLLPSPATRGDIPNDFRSLPQHSMQEIDYNEGAESDSDAESIRVAGLMSNESMRNLDNLTTLQRRSHQGTDDADEEMYNTSDSSEDDEEQGADRRRRVIVNRPTPSRATDQLATPGVALSFTPGRTDSAPEQINSEEAAHSQSISDACATGEEARSPADEEADFVIRIAQQLKARSQ